MAATRVEEEWSAPQGEVEGAVAATLLECRHEPTLSDKPVRSHSVTHKVDDDGHTGHAAGHSIDFVSDTM